MEEQFNIGPFLIKIFLREIKIEKDGNSLTFNPPSLSVATELILSAMRIESFAVLPRFLNNDPFILEFLKDKKMKLSKNEPNSNSITLGFEEGDVFLNAMDAAYKKWMDVTNNNTLRNDTPIPMSETPDSPFDSGH